MSAMPTTAGATPAAFAPAERRPLPGAATIVWAGRTALLVGAAMLVPGEAARICADLPARPRRD